MIIKYKKELILRLKVAITLPFIISISGCGSEANNNQNNTSNSSNSVSSSLSKSGYWHRIDGIALGMNRDEVQQILETRKCSVSGGSSKAKGIVVGYWESCSSGTTQYTIKYDKNEKVFLVANLKYVFSKSEADSFQRTLVKNYGQPSADAVFFSKNDKLTSVCWGEYCESQKYYHGMRTTDNNKGVSLQVEVTTPTNGGKLSNFKNSYMHYSYELVDNNIEKAQEAMSKAIARGKYRGDESQRFSNNSRSEYTIFQHIAGSYYILECNNQRHTMHYADASKYNPNNPIYYNGAYYKDVDDLSKLICS